MSWIRVALSFTLRVEGGLCGQGFPLVRVTQARRSVVRIGPAGGPGVSPGKILRNCISGRPFLMVSAKSNHLGNAS